MLLSCRVRASIVAMHGTIDDQVVRKTTDAVPRRGCSFAWVHPRSRNRYLLIPVLITIR